MKNTQAPEKWYCTELHISMLILNWHTNTTLTFIRRQIGELYTATVNKNRKKPNNCSSWLIEFAISFWLGDGLSCNYTCRFYGYETIIFFNKFFVSVRYSFSISRVFRSLPLSVYFFSFCWGYCVSWLILIKHLHSCISIKIVYWYALNKDRWKIRRYFFVFFFRCFWHISNVILLIWSKIFIFLLKIVFH